jgi:hypothetical protein
VRSFLRELSGSRGRARQPTALDTALWCPVHETLGVGEVFHDWDTQLLHRFGRDIIDSIPAHSIYFGGTDAGRFVITALSESHREGRPFFTLTQNALADGRYLEYLRQMYGASIEIPTTTDAQQAFNDYLADAQRRLQSAELKPGEDVKYVKDKVQVSGVTAVMDINARLVKTIFDQNPTREFFIEESFPLEWTYPYLTPHGLILKLNREPLPELSEAILREDHAYWRRYTGQLIGDWITDDTSVKEVCDFAARVCLRKDLSSFRGNAAFVRNEAAQKAFSKLRTATGGVYAWRVDQAVTPENKARLRAEADFAFRQALALSPSLPEATVRYANFLLREHRPKEALLVAQTGQRADPSNAQVRSLVQDLSKAQ